MNTTPMKAQLENILNSKRYLLVRLLFFPKIFVRIKYMGIKTLIWATNPVYSFLMKALSNF
jgi:hypothetical protein